MRDKPAKRIIVRILGAKWKWCYSKLRGNANGYCYIGDKVLIHDGLRGRRRLEIELHEFIHAANPTLDEQHVADQARDLAVILYDKLGYRLT